MEPKGSLLPLQVPAICPYPGPDQSSSCTPSQFLKIYFNIILPLKPGSSKGTLSFRFTNQNPVCTSSLSIRATCSVHLIRVDFIAWIIFGEGYRSLGSSLCSSLHSPITSSLLGPNILLSILFSNTFSPQPLNMLMDYNFAKYNLIID